MITFWATIETPWATFNSYIWLHWSYKKRSFVERSNDIFVRKEATRNQDFQLNFERKEI